MLEKSQIIDILNDLEMEEEIEILYACEAGSRIWGFAGEESDYDVRFIYKKANARDYLSLKDDRGVIELAGDGIDIVGWDIKKALKMHFKSNPQLREWLISPEVYIDNGVEGIFDDLGGFDTNILKNHYLNVALKHWKRYSGLEFGNVKIKKYLYVIRSILSWNLLNSRIDPPLSIQDLLDNPHCEVSSDINEAIFNLIEYIQYGSKFSEQTIFKLNNFILNSLNSMNKVKSESVKDIDMYDERFRLLMYR
ncbi:DNA polymerase beta superfamily protein [uncultured Methanobrevibacter sp.]|uniref:DNA polymerase beta superfamily protein n=1 Tax=uncultured Methanobrevibacter sp. TaxID=253161 RepID=UPI00262DF54F|nr:nucleotidyltransferase domain-containing protein [uncultured Methanobrevibacter sp.]